MIHPETVDIQNIILVNAEKKEDWAFLLHNHDRYLEISLVLSGKGTFYCEGRSYAMQAGDLVIKNAGVIHAEHSSRDDPIHQICISFSGVNEIPDAPGCILSVHMEPLIQSGDDFPILSAAFSYLAEYGRQMRNLLLAIL